MKTNHYIGKKSLYYYSDKLNLNAYQFDILKRVVRCRRKGERVQDLEKSLVVLELLKKEKKTNRFITFFKNLFASLSTKNERLLPHLYNAYMLNNIESIIIDDLIDLDFEKCKFNIERYLKYVKDD